MTGAATICTGDGDHRCGGAVLERRRRRDIRFQGGTFTGEIVDTWRIVTMIMVAEGSGHYQSAVWRAAVEISILIKDDNENVYVVPKVEGENTNVASPGMLKNQANQVIVEGDLIERDGVKYLLVTKVANDEGTTICAVVVRCPFAQSAHDSRTVTDKGFRCQYTLVYFGPLADSLQPVFNTVDPLRDTSEVTPGYAKAILPSLPGLTGVGGGRGQGLPLASPGLSPRGRGKGRLPGRPLFACLSHGPGRQTRDDVSAPHRAGTHGRGAAKYLKG